MTFQLSPQQSAVIDWVRNGRGSAFAEAVAGAGKTTTLIEIMKEAQGSVAYTAYNKKIVTEIEGKIAKNVALAKDGKADERWLSLGNRVRVGTFHSFGYGAWRKVYPAVKLDARAKERATEVILKLPKELVAFVPKLIGLAKQRGLGLFGDIGDQSRWYDIVDHFDLSHEIEDQMQVERGVELAIEGLRFHQSIAHEMIDFDDMIYMPVVTGTRMWENDWILVDEAQDTNPARRALARKMLRRNGRAIFVGDRHQAIYGFTGADSDAIDQIVRDFNCTTLPLTITFRCPKAVVEVARQVVSHIEAADTAPEGKVGEIEYADLFKPETSLSDADAILCRNTRPLVSLAYQLIRKGIPCHVEGKDIGIGLIKLVNRYAAKSLDDLRDKLETYLEFETHKLIAKGKETQADALTDRVETVFVIMEGCQTLDDLRNKIVALFLDSDNEAKPTLTLSTVHKSKGREWQRVFLLGRDQYMPSRWARQAWQLEQEDNLIYVAVTRAQSELVFVPDDAQPKKEG